jgi:hypothetical protein
VIACDPQKFSAGSGLGEWHSVVARRVCSYCFRQQARGKTYKSSFAHAQLAISSIDVLL